MAETMMPRAALAMKYRIDAVATGLLHVAMDFGDALSLALHGDRAPAKPASSGRSGGFNADAVTLVGRGLNDAVGALNSSAA